MAGFLTARASPPPRRRVGLAATAAAAAAAIAATAVAFASLPTVGQALNFDLPPGQEECFYEEVHAGTFCGGGGGGSGKGCQRGPEGRRLGVGVAGGWRLRGGRRRPRGVGPQRL